MSELENRVEEMEEDFIEEQDEMEYQPFEEEAMEEVPFDEMVAQENEELSLSDFVDDTTDEMADLEKELAAYSGSADDDMENEEFFVEDISGFAKGFPEWDLLPPTNKK